MSNCNKPGQLIPLDICEFNDPGESMDIYTDFFSIWSSGTESDNSHHPLVLGPPLNNGLSHNWSYMAVNNQLTGFYPNDQRYIVTSPLTLNASQQYKIEYQFSLKSAFGTNADGYNFVVIPEDIYQCYATFNDTDGVCSSLNATENNPVDIYWNKNSLFYEDLTNKFGYGSGAYTPTIMTHVKGGQDCEAGYGNCNNNESLYIGSFIIPPDNNDRDVRLIMVNRTTPGTGEQRWFHLSIYPEVFVFNTEFDCGGNNCPDRNVIYTCPEENSEFCSSLPAYICSSTLENSGCEEENVSCDDGNGTCYYMEECVDQCGPDEGDTCCGNIEEVDICEDDTECSYTIPGTGETISFPCYCNYGEPGECIRYDDPSYDVSGRQSCTCFNQDDVNYYYEITWYYDGDGDDMGCPYNCSQLGLEDNCGLAPIQSCDAPGDVWIFHETPQSNWMVDINTSSNYVDWIGYEETPLNCFCDGEIDACGVCGGNNSECSGCTDSEANNYDDEAVVDDGSCIYDDPTILGCTNELSCNYDDSATEDDESCILNDQHPFWDDCALGEPFYGRQGCDCTNNCGGFEYETTLCYDFDGDSKGCPDTEITICSNIETPANYVEDCSGECITGPEYRGVIGLDDGGNCKQFIDCETDNPIGASATEFSPEECCQAIYGNDSETPDAFLDYSVNECGSVESYITYECFFEDLPCIDLDGDGICDNVDDCIGVYDDCGVCNGNNNTCIGCMDSAACNYSTSYTFPCITPEQQDVMEVVGHFIHDIDGGIIDGGLMRTCFNNDWVATDGYNYGYADSSDPENYVGFTDSILPWNDGEGTVNSILTSNDMIDYTGRACAGVFPQECNAQCFTNGEWNYSLQGCEESKKCISVPAKMEYEDGVEISYDEDWGGECQDTCPGYDDSQPEGSKCETGSGWGDRCCRGNIPGLYARDCRKITTPYVGEMENSCCIPRTSTPCYYYGEHSSSYWVTTTTVGLCEGQTCEDVLGLGWSNESNSGQGIFGCITSTACNYDETAIVDDGTCIDATTGNDGPRCGCMDASATNYNVGCFYYNAAGEGIEECTSDPECANPQACDYPTEGSCTYDTPPNVPNITNFSISPTEVDINTATDITISYTHDGGSPDYILLYMGDFDNTSYTISTTGEIVNFTYPTSGGGGIKTLSLLLVNESGTSTSTTTINVLDPQAPVAIIQSNTTFGHSPLTVNFDASKSYDLNDNISTYEWDWTNDNTIDNSGETASHTFNNVGTYTTRLKVCDTTYLCGEDTINIVVQPDVTLPTIPELSNFSIENDNQIIVDVVETFNYSFTIANNGATVGNGFNVSIDWGDNSSTDLMTNIISDPFDEKTGTITHNYSSSGPKIITLTVTNDDGSSSLQTGLYVVDNDSPNAVIIGTPSTTINSTTGYFEYPLNINLDASNSYDPDGGDLNYAWFDTVSNALVNTSGEYTYTANSSQFQRNLDICVYNTGYVPPSYTSCIENYPNSMNECETEGYADCQLYTIDVNQLFTPVEPTAVITNVTNTGSVYNFDGSSSSAGTNGGTLTYSWDLNGDGSEDFNTDSITNYEYTSPGTYLVTLTVTNSEFNFSDTAYYMVVIPEVPVNNSPVAIITGGPFNSNNEYPSGTSIFFDGSSSYDLDGDSLTHQWCFDWNGASCDVDVINSISSTTNWNNTGNSNETFTIRLSVSDGVASGHLEKTITILPEVDITNPISTITLVGSAAQNESDGTILYTFNGGNSIITGDANFIKKYEWNFGDGAPEIDNTQNTLTGESPGDVNRTFYPGQYIVTLTVTDDFDSTDEGTYLIVVPPLPTTTNPVAILNGGPFNTSNEYPSGTTFTFDGSSSYDPDGTILTYSWCLDYDVVDEICNESVLTTESVTQTWENDTGANVTYVVRLVVTDENDESSSAVEQIITILPYQDPPTEPDASFSFVLDTGYTYNFDGTASAPGAGTGLTYSWDFGDGSGTSNQATPNYTYAGPGVYLVTLIVTNDLYSFTDTAVEVIDIPSYSDPVAIITGGPFSSNNEYSSGTSFTFDGVSSYDPDGAGISTYEWCLDWNGDSCDVDVLTTESVDKTWNNTTDANVTYIVRLEVSDGTSTNAITKTIIILPYEDPPADPEAIIVATNTEGNTYTFNGDTSTAGAGDITTYSWNFGADLDGDGYEDTSNEITPPRTYTYDVPGTYLITLEVTNSYGFSDLTYFTITTPEPIITNDPVAIITGGPFNTSNEYPSGTTFTFDGSSSYDLDGDSLTHQWCLDYDGASSSCNEDVQESTSITQTWENDTGETQEYRVRLEVIDESDASDDEFKTIKILSEETPITDPIANISYTSDENIFTFHGRDSVPGGGAANITSYEWDWGDGGEFDFRQNTPGGEDPADVEHTFDVGEHVVTLKVTDSNEFTDTTFLLVVIRPPLEDPVVILTGGPFYSNNQYPNGITINLNGEESYDPDGDDLTYSWCLDWNGDSCNEDEIGDSTFVTMTLNNDGADVIDKSIRLKVTDESGASDEETKQFLIQPEPETVLDPNAVFSTTVVSLDYDNSQYQYSFDSSTSEAGAGIITNYLWDFGDSTSSTEISPPHIYTNPGTYLVSLLITNSYGFTDSVSDIIYIPSLEDPVAIITGGPFYSDVYPSGTEVTFDGSSSYDPDGDDISSYKWDIDGEAQSEESSFTNTFTNDTNTDVEYVVNLVVTDNEGDSASTSKTITVAPIPETITNPTADISVTVSSDEYSFDGSGSTAGAGDITSYLWNLGGDNGTYDGVTPSGTYTYEPGSYVVTLTVTNSYNITNTAYYLIVVNPPLENPVAIITGGPFYSNNQYPSGTSVFFDGGESYDPEGTDLIYSWCMDFNNDSNECNDLNETSIETISETFTNGTSSEIEKWIRLTVIAGTRTDSSKKQILIQPVPDPIIEPTSIFTFVSTGLSYNFNGNSSAPGSGTIDNYYWDFGDGSSDNSNTSTVSHTYSSTGSYVVTLLVTNSFGFTDLSYQIITITPPFVNNLPVAIMSGGPFNDTNTYYGGTTFSFQGNLSYDIEDTIEGDEFLTIRWCPDYNSEDEECNIDWMEQSSPDYLPIEYIYLNETNDTIEYLLRLEVEDSNSGVDSSEKVMTILPLEDPITDPIANITLTNDGNVYQFDGRASVASSGEITNYHWDFGTGEVDDSNQAQVSYEYTEAGNYVVVLTVTDSNNLTDEAHILIRINPVTNPVAIITGNGPFGVDIENGTTVEFDGRSSYDPDGDDITGYYWCSNWSGSCFGEVSNSPTPTFTFQHNNSNLQTNTVLFRVTDESGAMGTTTMDISILPIPVDLIPPGISGLSVSPEVIFSEIENEFEITLTTIDVPVNEGIIYWGDGSNETLSPRPEQNQVNTYTLTHTYSSVGIYEITMRIENGDGYDEDSVFIQVTTEENPITVLYGYPSTDEYSTTGIFEYPFTLTLDATNSYDPDGGDIEYTFTNQVGDILEQNGGTGKVIITKDSQSGNYTDEITVLITDNEGSESTPITWSVDIQEYIEPEPEEVEPEPPCTDVDYTEHGCPYAEFCYFGSCYTFGDLNLDGNLDILDTVALVNYILESCVVYSDVQSTGSLFGCMSCQDPDSYKGDNLPNDDFTCNDELVKHFDGQGNGDLYEKNGPCDSENPIGENCCCTYYKCTNQSAFNFNEFCTNGCVGDDCCCQIEGCNVQGSCNYNPDTGGCGEIPESISESFQQPDGSDINLPNNYRIIDFMNGLNAGQFCKDALRTIYAYASDFEMNWTLENQMGYAWNDEDGWYESETTFAIETIECAVDAQPENHCCDFPDYEGCGDVVEYQDGYPFIRYDSYWIFSDETTLSDICNGIGTCSQIYTYYGDSFASDYPTNSGVWSCGDEGEYTISDIKASHPSAFYIWLDCQI